MDGFLEWKAIKGQKARQPFAIAMKGGERYAFVQNALLILPGMSDGSVTVVDFQKQEVVKSMDALKDAGFNPNCIVLLPAWYNAAGH